MASSDRPEGPIANQSLFKGVCYYLNESLRKPVRAALHDLLQSGGAQQCPPYRDGADADADGGDQFVTPDGRPPRFDPRRLTHFITDSLDFREYDLIRALNGREPQSDRKGKGKAREAHSGATNGTDDKVHIVTPAWATRSFDLQGQQQPRFYSADKTLFFSGSVVSASELPPTDRRDIFQAVVAFGGQSRQELTREVTHLICPSGAGRKYEMALKHGTELGMQVVLPKWFEESFKHSKLVPTAVYRFPDPPYATTLRDGSSGKPFADRLFEYWRSRLPGGPNAGSTSTAAVDGPPSVIPNTATYVILGYPDASGAIPDGGASRPSDTQRYLRTTVDFASNKRKSQSAYPPDVAGDDNTEAAAQDRDDDREMDEHRGFFADKRVYLASVLALTFPMEEAFRAQISRHGGTCSSFHYGPDDFPASEQEAEDAVRNKRASTTDGADAWEARRQAEKRLKESDIVIIHVREGWEYWTAYEAGLSIGNPQYFYDCLRMQTLLSPLSRIGYYPVPSTEGLPDWPVGNHGGKPVVTVSNYAGESRDYVRTLIELLGGTFEGTMTKQTDYVISAAENGSKVSHAREWHIPLVTHLWLEALILDWRYIPPSADPSYLLSGSSAGGTHYATLLGDTPYTREVIARWAAREEVRVERNEAMRSIEELEEAERADAPVQDGVAPGSDQAGMEIDRAAGQEEEEEAPVQQRRPSLSPTIDRPPRPQSKAVESPVKPRARTKTPMPVPSNREASAEPVQQAVPAESAPAAARRPAAEAAKKTPAKGNGSKSDGARRKRDRSDSTLSSASSSSSSSDHLPPSANKMTKAFAMISGENLVQGGSRRGAAAKAQAALVDQIKDRNAFEKELKSSGRKKGGVSRRSRSPSKKVTHDDDIKDEEMSEDEAAPPAPVSKAKGKASAKPKAKSRKQSVSDDDDNDGGLEEGPARKKPKTGKAAPPVSKQVKNLQASANGTTQDGGAVSSFDRPPNAKPAPVKPKKVKIISTGLGLDKDHTDIKKMKTLGASWTDTSKDATHLVVKGISRTEKFLCSLPYAPKIVTPAWISACLAANRLIDEMPYLLKDVKKEKEIGDTLENILDRARQRKLFDGYNVYVTRQIQPDTSVMQRVISACGGTVHTKDLSKFVKKIVKDPTALVVSCEKDKREWQALAAAPHHQKIYSVEAILQAVLHQNLERGFIEDHRIDARWEE